VAWILYDWANSGYGLVWSVLFSAVFVGAMLPKQPSWDRRVVDGEAMIVSGLSVFGIEVPGSAVFAILVSIVATLTVLTAPVLGALADAKGWQKRLLIATATGGSLAAMLVAFVPAGWDWTWVFSAILYVLSFYLFGLSITFYNAYLPVIAGAMGENKLGGWGFAVGYIGGAVMLVIAALLLPAWLGDGAYVYHLGLAGAGLWWLLFSVPIFIAMPAVAPAADAGNRPPGLFGPFVQVGRTLKDLRQYRMLFLFLLAFLIYINGVESVIALSSAFAEDVLMMGVRDLTIMFLIVQVVAFVGAAISGYAAERFGCKTVIMSTLAMWCVGVGLTYFVQNAFQFTLLGSLIGLVLGGVQSSSRTLMSKLTPPEIRNEAFGFYAIGTKAMSVFGPLLFAVVGTMFGPRLSVFAVLPFLIIGLILLSRVQEPRAV
jgi:UMF1 family MFS transporter